MNKTFLFITCIFFSLITSSQVTPIDPKDDEEETQTNSASDQKGESKFFDRFVVGGNLGASFGNTTYIDASPLIGYKVTPAFIAGAGFTYQFVSYKDPYGFYADYKANVLGPRVFLEYDLFMGIFAHAEYEYLWVSITPEEPYLPYKAEAAGLFPGLGYKSQIGNNAYLKVLALYNVLWTSSSPLYSSPFQLRFGFTIGG